MMLLFLFVLVASPVASAVELELKVESEDYRITQEVRSSLERVLHRVLGVYAGKLGLDFPAVVNVELTIVADRVAYDRMAAEVGVAHWSSGFYQSGGRAVVWGNTTEQRMLRTFLHESAHFLLGHGGRRAPSWVNEGLADCFGHTRTLGNAAFLELDTDALRLIQRDHRAGKLITVSRIVSMPNGWHNLSRSSARSNYAYAWALCHMLLATRHGQELLRQALDDFQRTGDSSAMPGIIERNHPGGMDALEKTWVAWVESEPAPIPLAIWTGDGKTATGWKKCDDGRLVKADNPNGCRSWVRQPDGVFRLQ